LPSILRHDLIIVYTLNILAFDRVNSENELPLDLRVLLAEPLNAVRLLEVFLEIDVGNT
jgi:hypothetical protein